jgi:hypothetical protein
MTVDKTKIVVAGVDHPAYVGVEQTGCSEIRAWFRIFTAASTRFTLHSRPTARLVINTLRKCADEIERIMNVLPENKEVKREWKFKQWEKAHRAAVLPEGN